MMCGQQVSEVPGKPPRGGVSAQSMFQLMKRVGACRVPFRVYGVSRFGVLVTTHQHQGSEAAGAMEAMPHHHHHHHHHYNMWHLGHHVWHPGHQAAMVVASYCSRHQANTWEKEGTTIAGPWCVARVVPLPHRQAAPLLPPGPPPPPQGARCYCLPDPNQGASSHYCLKVLPLLPEARRVLREGRGSVTP